MIMSFKNNYDKYKCKDPITAFQVILCSVGVVATLLLAVAGLAYLHLKRLEKQADKPTEPIETNQLSSCKDSTDVLVIAKNIFHEARSHKEDWLLVYWVVQNRVASKRYPNNVTAVVYQPKQFSWTSLDKKVIAQREAKEQSTFNDIVNFVSNYHCNSKDKTDITNGVKHYHASNIKVKWAKAKKPVIATSAHVYYNNIN